MSKVSIIIPAYNQGLYLHVAIESALNQTYSDLEVIVVDDGSTDNTGEVAQSFDDPRVRYIYRENGGLSAARNTGIAASIAPFITFLDSDDIFLPTKLSLLMPLLLKHPTWGMVAGGMKIMNSDGTILDHEVSPPADISLDNMLLGNLLVVGGVLLRREWVERIGDFDESFRACEDWDLWLRMLRAGCVIGSIPEPVYVYRLHQGQMTREAERMRIAMLSTLNKFYAEPSNPSVANMMRPKAYSAAYCRAALREYAAGTTEVAKKSLEQAVELDPTLAENNYQKLVSQVAGWAYASSTPDTCKYLKTVYDNLPPSLSGMWRHHRQEMATALFAEAVKFYREGELEQAGAAARSAVSYKPLWLMNQGIISILTRSMIHTITT